MFTVYVTDCDLEKSITFDTTVEITALIRFSCKHIVANIFRRMRFKKVSNS